MKAPDSNLTRSRLVKSIGTVLVNVLALLAAVLAQPDASGIPFAVMLAAIAFTSWYGGRIPGLAAVLFATFGTEFILMKSTGTRDLIAPSDVERLAVFALVSLLASSVTSARAGRLRSEQRQQDLEREQRWMEVVVDRMPTPLVLIESESGRVLFANRSARTLADGALPIAASGDSEEETFWQGRNAIAPTNMPVARAARGEKVEDMRIDWRPESGRRALLVSAERVVPGDDHNAVVVMPFQDITSFQDAQNALRQSEERYRTVSDTVPIGIYHLDPTGRRVYVNHHWRLLIGLEGNRTVDECWEARIHPDDHDRVMADQNEAVREGLSYSCELRLRREGRSDIWVRDRATVLRNRDGNVEGFVGTVYDISDWEQARQSLHLLGAVTETLQLSPISLETLRRVARLTVPRLAHWCILDIENGLLPDIPLSPSVAPPPSGRRLLRRMAAVHEDPSLEPFLLDRRFGIEAPRAFTAAWEEALSTGKPRLVHATGSKRRSQAGFGDRLPLEMCEAICIPLVSRERVLGMMVLGKEGPGLPYDEQDAGLGERLGRQVAFALDSNALLQEARDAERQLNHQLQFTQAITGSVAEGVCAVDPSGTVIFANPAASDLLGWQIEDLLASDFHKLVHPCQPSAPQKSEAQPAPRDPAESSMVDAFTLDASVFDAFRVDAAIPDFVPCPACQLRETILNGGSLLHDESSFHRRDGSLLPVVYSVCPIELQGSATGSVIAFHDVSTQKREEQSLREIARQRADLVATVSHALRAPLASMLANLDVLSDDVGERLQESEQACIDRAVQGAVDLSATIDNLLTMSRLHEGQSGLQIAWVGVEELLREVHLQMLPRATAMEAVLEVTSDVAAGTVQTDPQKLKQIIIELIENGLKYSGPHAHVRVTAVGVGGSVWVRVQDNGPGVPEEEMPHLFTPFYRGAEAMQSQAPGTGLGLSIVKEMTQLLNIELSVRSTETGGTQFSVKIPRMSEKLNRFKIKSDSDEMLQKQETLARGPTSQDG